MPDFPTAMTAEDFHRNLGLVEQRIAAACERVERDRSQVRLLPVSKTVDEPRMRAAAAAGMRDFGENKVQEAKAKAAALADLPGLSWAVIGHLQTNKAKDVVAFASEFQALDKAERENHPEVLFLTALTIWAARVTAGEELGLLDAVDIPAAAVRWIAEPSDKKAAAAGKAQPRSGAPKRKK